MKKLITNLWRALTYWPVICEYCNGTGICTALQNRWPASKPHSCCGNCQRVRVSVNAVPEGFCESWETHAIIGDGIMYRRPWSRKQVTRPWRMN